MSTIDTLWTRLETWARAHAPAMLTDLNGPASPDAIDGLQQTLGLDLPDDFRASLAVHDGEHDGWPNRIWRGCGALLPCAQIPGFVEQLRNVDAEYGEPIEDPEQLAADGIITVSGPVKVVGFDPRRVPIMNCNGDTQWFLDLDPAPGGTPGQVIRVDLECCEWVVLAPSFRAFFEDYVQALEAGEFSLRIGDLPDRPDSPKAQVRTR